MSEMFRSGDTMTPKLIIPIGPAGCGKTTWWTSMCQGHVSETQQYQPNRISSDEIRFNILDYPNSGIDFDPTIEPQVWAQVWADLIFYLSERLANIYLDCTNLTRARRAVYIHCARAFGYEIEIVWFKTGLCTCLSKNMLRDRNVPDVVIARQYLALQPPEPWEYDMLTEVR